MLHENSGEGEGRLFELQRWGLIFNCNHLDLAAIKAPVNGGSPVYD